MLTLETCILIFRSKDEFEIESEQPNHHDWTIQVLRSLDSESCHFSDVDSRPFLNVSKSGTLVDDTIYRNLIWQIRNAKRYCWNQQLNCIWLKRQPTFIGIWLSPFKFKVHLFGMSEVCRECICLAHAIRQWKYW